MAVHIFVFDPTRLDSLSKARGIGRYLQILKENFPNWTYSNKLPPIPYTLYPVFLNPFFNFFHSPVSMNRIAQKQIAIIHDLIPLKYPSHFPVGIKGKLNVFLNQLALRNYDVIITDSEASKKDIIKILGIDEIKIKVIYPCLPKIFTRKTTPYSLLPTPYCLYVGDATWNKNLVNLAKAIKILNVTCIFVGKIFSPTSHRSPTANHYSHPWQLELKRFFEEIRGDKRFILKGFVPDEKLIQLYRQARVNILPSHDEGFGFSYLEAASQKCPSVLAGIDVLHEISGGNAMFADPHDPHSLADAIGELYFHQDVRNTLGAKSYERSKQFSSLEFKKKFLHAIQ